MRKIEIILGTQYGELTVLKESDPHVQASGRKERVILCECSCGNKINVQLNNIRSGHTRSCGCLRGEFHGDTESHLYSIWTAIKRRCYNPNTAAAKYYYDRGIDMCDEWKDSYTIFKEWSLSNGYTEELSIDRIDHNKGYYPDNCRWVTMSENIAEKNRKYNIVYKDELYSLDLLLKKLNRSSEYKIIYKRLYRGWDLMKALTEPPLN